jgi:glycosyltransferase involved in cell wall biosynthesis
MSEPFFNYIITIHNKENLIHDVLVSILLCCGPNSTVYPVLDGCTDNTEKIIDELLHKYQGVPVVKLLYAPDVHEILSINTGLRAAPQEGDGYNIILQDDVILADLDFESKIKQLYAWGGEKLGVVSFRMGANFAPDVLTSGLSTPLTDFVENAYGHGITPDILLPGRFAYRTIPIKSPICIPTKIVREIGMMNENLAPYQHDDTDLAVRTTTAGYRNGVLALRFYSDVRWGGVRVNPHPELPTIEMRNMNRIREWYGPELQKIVQAPPTKDITTFPKMGGEELDKQAIEQYESTKALTHRLQNPSFFGKVRNRLRRIIGERLKAKKH